MNLVYEVKGNLNNNYNTNNFSVLLPVYQKDCPEYLIQALNSIFNQTLQPAEVVVVVDGFIDKELHNVLKSYKTALTIQYYSKNLGLGTVLATGVELCQYNIIARMDADDICVPDRFEKQITFLNHYPDIDIVGSHITEFEGSIENSTGVRKVPINNRKIKKYAKKRNPFNHMSIMFRKEAVINVGNYQHMPLFEDYYLWVRMIQKNIKMANVNESLVYVRTGKRMYDKRGGIPYAKNELEFQKRIYALEFISCIEVIKNMAIRTWIRLLPSRTREKIYIVFLRSKNKPTNKNMTNYQANHVENKQVILVGGKR